jgi:hypothetical protein
LSDFKARVDKYVDVRKTADDSAPPLEETADPAKTRAAQQALAERVGAARRGAKQGRSSRLKSPRTSGVFSNPK